MPLDYLPYNLYQFETIVELPPALLVRVIMHELCLFHLHLLPAALKLMQTSCLSIHRGLMTRI